MKWGGGWNFIAMATALAMAGCADGATAYQPSAYARVVPDGNTVTITHAHGEGDARPLADGYCAQLDRVARFDHMSLFRAGHVRSSSSSAVFVCEGAEK